MPSATFFLRVLGICQRQKRSASIVTHAVDTCRNHWHHHDFNTDVKLCNCPTAKGAPTRLLWPVCAQLTRNKLSLSHRHAGMCVLALSLGISGRTRRKHTNGNCKPHPLLAACAMASDHASCEQPGGGFSRFGTYVGQCSPSRSVGLAKMVHVASSAPSLMYAALQSGILQHS